MVLDPLFAAPIVVQIHAFAAMAAFVFGIIQFAAPKGTLPHRTLGYAWVGLMLAVAASSFAIHGRGQWAGFSVIHLLSILVLALTPLAVLAAHGDPGEQRSRGAHGYGDRSRARRAVELATRLPFGLRGNWAAARAPTRASRRFVAQRLSAEVRARGLPPFLAM